MADVQVQQTSLRFVTRALTQVEPELRRELQPELFAIGNLVASDAQKRALSGISGMSQSPGWSRMRVGVAPSVIYVVPRNKGVRGKGPKRRRNFAPLMLNRAMRPALASKKSQVDRRFAAVVSAVCSRFNGGARGR